MNSCGYALAGRTRPWPTPAAVVLLVCRIAVAFTWVYNGFWLKIMDPAGPHTMIVAETLGISPARATAVTAMIGVLECGLALAVMWGRRPWSVAAVQAGALVSMNTAGVLGAPDRVGSLAELFVRSFTFMALVLVVAFLGSRRHGKSC